MALIEIDHGVDLDAHVVARDHVLVGNVHGERAQRHLDHAVDDREKQDEPRPLGPDDAAEAENDAALVLVEHAQRSEKQKKDYGRKGQ
jgi:hypothetical protein